MWHYIPLPLELLSTHWSGGYWAASPKRIKMLC
jgi:hypothetical protein